MQKVEQIDNCPECNSDDLIEDYSRGELVCKICGFVIEDNIIDHTPEWRAFDHDQYEKKARVGSPMKYTLHDKGLSTEIGWKNRDFYGRSVPPRNRAQIFRLRKWQRRIRISDGTERNLVQALSMLDRFSSSLNLPRIVRETAAMMYRKIASKKICRGRNVSGITAAVIYGSCRQCNVPRTLNEISAATQLPKKEIGRNYRYISRSIKLNILPTSPEDYVSRFCSQLNLSNNVKVRTLEIITLSKEKEIISGRGPAGIASASMYIASLEFMEKVTQREISEVAGVTEVTIRNRYKEIIEKLKIKTPKQSR